MLTHTLLLLSSLLLPHAFTHAPPIQTVEVGGGGQLNFYPDTINAPVGSQVEFVFYARNHSVASSTYDVPCQPDGRYFSGYYPTPVGNVSNDAFLITITDSNPIWYYCGQTAFTHCQNGMVAVINPPTSGPQSLAAYRSASFLATGRLSGDLPNIVGGQKVPLDGVASSSARAPAAPTTTTTTTTSTRTTSTGSSVSSARSIVLFALTSSPSSNAPAPTSSVAPSVASSAPASTVSGTTPSISSIASASVSAGVKVVTVTTTRRGCLVTTVPAMRGF